MPATPEPRKRCLAVLVIAGLFADGPALATAPAAPAATTADVAVRQLTNGDADVRDAAQRSLFVLDRTLWRIRLPDLIADADLVAALTALELATQDAADDRGVAPSREIAEEVAARWNGRSWYPLLGEAFVDLWTKKEEQRARTEWYRAARAAAAQGLPPPPPPGPPRTLEELRAERQQLEMESNDAKFAAPIAAACPDDSIAMPRSTGTLWHEQATLAAAVAATKIDAREVVAALRGEDGWFVGRDGGEFGGLVTFSARPAPQRLLARTATEPRVIFGFAGSTYFVAGGLRWEGDPLAELQRIGTSATDFAPRSVMHLPAPPTDAIIVDGRLLLRLERNGWVELSMPISPHRPKALSHVVPRWLGCGAEPPSASD